MRASCSACCSCSCIPLKDQDWKVADLAVIADELLSSQKLLPLVWEQAKKLNKISDARATRFQKEKRDPTSIRLAKWNVSGMLRVCGRWPVKGIFRRKTAGGPRRPFWRASVPLVKTVSAAK